MSDQGASGESAQLGAVPTPVEDDRHVRVRKGDLLVVLEAAQQLHSTPLITARDHERLGRAINSIRAGLESGKPFSLITRTRP
jgi:hypothetical protein